jgi:hypothetical protein
VTSAAVFLPAQYNDGAIVEFRGWPKGNAQGLAPLNAAAHRITEYMRVMASQALPDTPFDERGVLYLPFHTRGVGLGPRPPIDSPRRQPAQTSRYNPFGRQRA